MGKTNKRKAKAVALATAAVLVLAGTIAYLADASGTIRNVFDNEHVRVQINETGVEKDNGDKPYTILPGTSEGKDPTITVDTDTDAYVFAVVKDTVNSHKKEGASEATKFVDYTIDSGWTLLDVEGLTKKEDVKKYVDILNNKTDGNLTVDPTDPNTKIYYRIVHGAESDDHSGDTHRFTYKVLTNDQVSYPTTLTNEDMNLLNSITEAEQKALIFQTWAIQMEPFCPEDEVAGADPATADQKQYAKDAWNETKVVPKAVTVSQAEGKNSVKIGETLPLVATVTPKNAVDKNVTWSSSDTTKATVDESGVVTGVAVGAVTITATATGATGVSGTYEVNVEENKTFGYAVQLHSTDGGTITFWPAMGVNAVNEGVTCGREHCIHNDSWEEIKAHPDNYSECISNGCTKKVLINDTAAAGFGMTKTTGDGGGIVTKAPWAESGDNTKPTFETTLNSIKSAIKDGPSNPTMFLLSYANLGSPTIQAADSSRLVYDQRGNVSRWWLKDRYDGSNYAAYRVHTDGGVWRSADSRLSDGIAPGFSY